MTANVITYRGRSAAREVGKALSLEPEQIDRLAKVMNHFEWVDPLETLERNLREVGIDGDLPGPPGRHRSARKRHDARSRRRAMGQGRLRGHGADQGRPARARD